MMQDQAIANLQLHSETERGLLGSENGSFSHHYSQQPCTKNTLRKRLAIAQQFCRKEDPVLLVGDDDYVGIELIDAGFTDVTSVDIDPKVCDSLRAYARKQGKNLRVLQHNLEKVAPLEYCRPYKLVFIDPMYSEAGLDLFLKGAFSFLNREVDTYFFLSFHILSTAKGDQLDLAAKLKSFDLKLHRVFPTFNSYPMAFRYRFLLSILIRSCIRTKAFAQLNYSLSHFFSDGLLLQVDGNRTKERA